MKLNKHKFDSIDLTKLDWKHETNNYGNEEIERIVNEGETTDLKLDILSAIESQFKLDQARDGIMFSAYLAQRKLSFITSLRDHLLLRQQTENLELVKRLPSEEEILKDKIQKLESENEELKLALARKEEEMTVLQHEKDQDKNMNSNRCKDLVLLELLKKLNVGTGVNDMTKIAKLAQYLIGGSYDKHYQYIQQGNQLTSHHDNEIKRVNQILSDLDLDITINKG